MAVDAAKLCPQFTPSQARRLAQEINAQVATPVVPVSGAISAAGTDQAGATALTAGLNIVASATYGTSEGVKLPASGVVIGSSYVVFNSTTHPIKIYPASGGSINGLAVDAPIYVRRGGRVTITMGTLLNGWALGEQISSLNDEWVHVRATITNNVTPGTIFSKTVAEQSGVFVEGTWVGGYVGKTTLAVGFGGKFHGSVARSAAGNATGNISIATLITAFPASGAATVTTSSRGDLNANGAFDGSGSGAAAGTAAVFPFCRVVVPSSTEVGIQARGIVTDTVEIFASANFKTVAGQ